MAGQGIVELSSANFATVVSRGVVLVDCWAPWCGPCLMQGRILEELAAANTDPNVVMAKLNVDEAPDIAAQFGIRAIPTLLLFRNGQLVRQFVGVQSGATLRAAIQQAAGSANRGQG